MKEKNKKTYTNSTQVRVSGHWHVLVLTTEPRILEGTGGSYGAGRARRTSEIHLTEDYVTY